MSKKEKRDTKWLGAIVPEYVAHGDDRRRVDPPLSREKARETAENAGHGANSSAAQRVLSALYQKALKDEDHEQLIEIERAFALEPSLWTETAVTVHQLLVRQSQRHHRDGESGQTSSAIWLILIDNLIGVATRMARDVLPGTLARQVCLDAVVANLDGSGGGESGNVLVDMVRAMAEGGRG